MHLHTNKTLSAGFTHRDFIIFVFYFFLRPRSASPSRSAQEVPSCRGFFFLFFLLSELPGKKTQPEVLQLHLSALVVALEWCLVVLWQQTIGILANQGQARCVSLSLSLFLGGLSWMVSEPAARLIPTFASKEVGVDKWRWQLSWWKRGGRLYKEVEVAEKVKKSGFSCPN